MVIERPLRIAFVDYVLEPDKPGRSGLSDIVWDMATELANQGHEPHIIASYHTDVYPDPRVRVHNFPTPPIGYRNIVGQLWILKRAADIARRLDVDIVHAPEYLSTAVFSVLRVQKPLVLTVPGNIFHRLATPGGSSYEWFYAQILKWAARRSAKRCAYVIAISTEMKHWWEWSGSSAEQTPIIPLGVDSKRFHYVPSARAQLGLMDGPLLLLYVGRFAVEKGLPDLVAAIRSLPPEMLVASQIQVFLIGRGPQADELKSRIREAGLTSIVHTRGWISQDELPAWYSAADAFVLPSYTEGFSRTIPEALSCGTPVIASRISGSSDHITNGLNGFLFAPGDVDALSSLLKSVVDAPQAVREIRGTVLQYATDNLTWQTVVKEVWHRVYLPIMGTG